MPEKKCSICRRRSQGSARPAPAAPMNGLRPPLTPPPSDAGGQISGAWQPPCRASGTNFILQKTICEKLLTVPFFSIMICSNSVSCCSINNKIDRADHKAKGPRNARSFCFLCVRQNLVFLAIFESVSDDNFFIPYFLNSNLYSASANFLEKIGGTAFPIILYASACVPTNS